VKADRNVRYGRRHRQLRAELRGLVESGQASCARCGKPIRPGEPWDLGHVDGDSPGPAAYAGPEHRACNRATSRRREPGPALRQRSDGYLEDPAGQLYRATTLDGYQPVSRAW
jgi:hypothetical protein